MAREPARHPHSETASARTMVVEAFQPALERASLSAAELNDRFNVIDAGVVDSIEFLDLVAGLEQRAGVQLDLFDADPDVLTTIGGLVSLLEDALHPSASPDR